MKNRSVVAAMVVAASMLTTEALCVAPAFAASKPFSAVFSREKLVKFNVRNSTSAPIKVKAGQTEMTLAPGQTTPMKLAVGTEVVCVDSTEHYKSGEVIVTVGSQHSDATIVLN